ncbi:hypothetical protein CRX72_13330 [Pantoea sp. BRM17]|nr:hypothetical protein CRX72_13330 [Pantoea sp. BRM17]
MQATLLQVPHHGSRTSSTPLFLRHISGEAAVASVARYNAWRMPARSVVKRYQEQGYIRSALGEPGHLPCVRGQQWQWGRLRFTALWPPALPVAGHNNDSCVVRVDDGQVSLLLTGDLEQAGDVAITQGREVVLYDTGPAWQQGDAGERTILPWLNYTGRTLQGVILSHRHLDHRGGLNALLRARPALAAGWLSLHQTLPAVIVIWGGLLLWRSGLIARTSVRFASLLLALLLGRTDAQQSDWQIDFLDIGHGLALQIFLFQGISLTALLANLLAVPVISFITVPLLLLALLVPLQQAAQPLWWLADRSVDYLMQALQWLPLCVGTLLLFDPLAVLSESFWLSALAVAMLIIWFSWFALPYPYRTQRRWLPLQLLHLQLGMMILMAPARAIQFALPARYISWRFPLIVSWLTAALYCWIAGSHAPAQRAMLALTLWSAIRAAGWQLSAWQIWLRATLVARYQAALAELKQPAILQALAFGDRSQMLAPLRQLLRDTGTAHLMAISGMHIALAATGGWLLFVQISNVNNTENWCAGQRWHMRLRLRAVHGRLNEGGYDLQRVRVANHMPLQGRIMHQQQMSERCSLAAVLAGITLLVACWAQGEARSLLNAMELLTRRPVDATVSVSAIDTRQNLLLVRLIRVDGRLQFPPLVSFFLSLTAAQWRCLTERNMHITWTTGAGIAILATLPLLLLPQIPSGTTLAVLTLIAIFLLHRSHKPTLNQAKNCVTVQISTAKPLPNHKATPPGVVFFCCHSVICERDPAAL